MTRISTPPAGCCRSGSATRRSAYRPCRSPWAANAWASAAILRASASMARNCLPNSGVHHRKSQACVSAVSSRCPRAPFLFPAVLLHLAVLHIRVAARAQDGAHGLVHDAAVVVLADELQVVVLHRELVRAELELAAYALEVGGPQRGAQRVLVLDPALDLADRGIHQHRRVVARSRVAGRQALVLLLELGDELAVGRVVQVDRPVADAEQTQHRVADRADDVLVGAPQRHDELDLL